MVNGFTFGNELMSVWHKIRRQIDYEEQQGEEDDDTNKQTIEWAEQKETKAKFHFGTMTNWHFFLTLYVRRSWFFFFALCSIFFRQICESVCMFLLERLKLCLLYFTKQICRLICIYSMERDNSGEKMTTRGKDFAQYEKLLYVAMPIDRRKKNRHAKKIQILTWFWLFCLFI